MSGNTLFGGYSPSFQSRGSSIRPPSYWWLGLPDRPTHLTFTFNQRIFGPMYSHTGERLGFGCRLIYGWLYTDDPYFDRVDAELKFKGI